MTDVCTDTKPDPAPLRRFVVPFPGAENAVEDPQQYTVAWGKAVCDGFYPLGLNGQWHGGIHFDEHVGATCNLNMKDGVRCIADGEVIAYRYDTEPPKSTYKNFGQVNAQFATSFVLVRHRLQIPDWFVLECTAESPPSCILYSLYMHLQHWKTYEDNKTIERPSFWGLVGSVDENCTDPVPKTIEKEPAPPENGVGINLQHKKTNAVIGWVPRNTRIKLKGKQTKGFHEIDGFDGDYFLCKGYTKEDLPNIGKVNAKNLAIAGSPSVKEGTVYIPDKPIAIKAGELVGHLGNYMRFSTDVVNSSTKHPMVHLEVFAGPELENFIAKCRELDARAFASDKRMLKIEKEAKPVLLQEQEEVLQGGEYLMPAEDSPRGSWLTKLVRCKAETAELSKLPKLDAEKQSYGNKLLYEVITKDGTDPISASLFVGNEKKYPNHTKAIVVTPDKGDSVWVPWYGEMTHGNKNDIFIADSLNKSGWKKFPLEAGVNEEKGSVVATLVIDVKKPSKPLVKRTAADDKGAIWWKVNYPVILNDQVIQKEAWVGANEEGSNKIFPKVEYCSPWAWPGFEQTPEDTSAKVDWFKRRQEDEYSPDSPILNQLFKLLDEDGNRKLSRDEITKQAWEKHWLVQPLSRLIIQHKSEWGCPMAEWFALDTEIKPCAGKEQCSKVDYKDAWEQDKERIRTLRWWDKVAGKHGFPSDFKVWHIHPLALIENFSSRTMAPWLRIAWYEEAKYRGKFENQEPLKSAILNDYYRLSNLYSAIPNPDTTKVSWCGAFAYWCMVHAGYPNSAKSPYRAFNWLKDNTHAAVSEREKESWKEGEVVKKPFVGAIAILKGSHVGFVIGETVRKQVDRIVLLGGNQGSRVKVSHWPKTNVEKYLKPIGYEVYPEEELLPFMNIEGEENDSIT